MAGVQRALPDRKQLCGHFKQHPAGRLFMCVLVFECLHALPPLLMLSIGHSNYWASENDHMTISVFLGFLKKIFLVELNILF